MISLKIIGWLSNNLKTLQIWFEYIYVPTLWRKIQLILLTLHFLNVKNFWMHRLNIKWRYFSVYLMHSYCWIFLKTTDVCYSYWKALQIGIIRLMKLTTIVSICKNTTTLRQTKIGKHGTLLVLYSTHIIYFCLIKGHVTFFDPTVLLRISYILWG